jgi:hypothetical protein
MKIKTRSVLMFAGAVLVGYMAYNLWQRRKGALSQADDADNDYSGFINRGGNRNRRLYGQAGSGTCPPSCEFPPSTKSTILSN